MLTPCNCVLVSHAVRHGPEDLARVVRVVDPACRRAKDCHSNDSVRLWYTRCLVRAADACHSGLCDLCCNPTGRFCQPSLHHVVEWCPCDTLPHKNPKGCASPRTEVRVTSPIGPYLCLVFRVIKTGV